MHNPSPVRKVLHVIPSMGARRGGPSVMLRALASDLCQAGIETHIATTDDDGPGTLSVPYGVPMRDHGVTYWYFPRQTRLYTFSWPLSVWLARHVREFQLVHIHALFAYPTLPAAFWAWRHGVPYVVRPLGTLNGWGMQNRRPWLKTLSFWMIERRLLGRAAFVHYTSTHERRQAERLHVKATAAVIPNPVSEGVAPPVPGRFRARHPDLRDRRIILFLSRIDAVKGLDLLLRAFKQVLRRQADAALVIAGSGDPVLIARLKRETDALGIATSVFWVGMLEGADKRDALMDADMFVLPSYSENFGIAAAEAMAAGVPVVISNQVGIHDDVARADAGFVVPCKDQPLAMALSQLLGDAQQRSRMGVNGQALVQREYSSRAVTQKLIEAYSAVVH